MGIETVDSERVKRAKVEEFKEKLEKGLERSDKAFENIEKAFDDVKKATKAWLEAEDARRAEKK